MRHLDKFIIPGKVNMCIGGGFGSTGKGAISAAIAMDNDITVSCSTTSPNAGHTFYWDDRKYVTHLIPASAIINNLWNNSIKLILILYLPLQNLF